jgi:hypothetical protein
MNCKGWDCNIPQCSVCLLAMSKVRKSRQQDSPVAGARAILETKQLTKER